ncbi:MAG: type I-C CRISPR-associated protein Cas8c/Csd1 [Ruminococcus sp.]|jgi:CRISPR-associated protein Csd1
MLIQGLCDYYDILAKDHKVLPAEYSCVSIHYLVALDPEGRIDEIMEYRKKEAMPKRTERPGVFSSVIEHRPAYLFGLHVKEGRLTPDDSRGKIRKSHEIFVKTNLEFIQGIDTPPARAFACFLKNWKPEEEQRNPWLLALGRNFDRAGYVFCPSGMPEHLLHRDEKVKEKWENMYRREEANGAFHYAQCAVSGRYEPIARLHGKIRGVYGGMVSGNVMIGYNNPSEWSYGQKQSYNSNISKKAMEKYTKALNYLLAGSSHKAVLDDITVVFWALDGTEGYEDILHALLWGGSKLMDARQTERMLEALFEDAKKGTVLEERIKLPAGIRSDVDFYMIGIKPNMARLSLQFLYKSRFADILIHIAKFQKELKISPTFRPVSFYRIKKELTVSKNNLHTISPLLISRLLESVLYGGDYPKVLLETVVKRVKTDIRQEKINSVRAGIIKACLERNYREVIRMTLDRENRQPAYLCGRLFAVVEKLQQDSAPYLLNRTIREMYFASACTKPASVFPTLLKMAQNYLGKAKYSIYYSKLIREIIDGLEGEFPDALLLKDQGRFIIGYYQQQEDFYQKKKEKENGVEEPV